MIPSLKNIPRIEARAAISSLAIGTVLLAIKFIAYFLTGSTVIFSDAIESIVNVAAAAFALYALAMAHLPADQNHPYGHGKIEFLSAGFEGGMILLAAVATVFKAIDSLVHGSALQRGQLATGLVLMSLALGVNGAMGWFLVRTGKKHNSITLEADGWHLLTDALTSIIALLAILLVYFTDVTWLDPVAALIISAYIARTGVRLMGRSAAGLMDEQDEHDTQTLQQILNAHLGPAGHTPHICSYHKLRHRHSGRYHWVDFHIMVPKDWNVDEGHRVASRIEYEIEQTLGEGNATAHIEPCSSTNCSNCAQGPASDEL